MASGCMNHLHLNFTYFRRHYGFSALSQFYCVSCPKPSKPVMSETRKLFVCERAADDGGHQIAAAEQCSAPGWLGRSGPVHRHPRSLSRLPGVLRHRRRYEARPAASHAPSSAASRQRRWYVGGGRAGLLLCGWPPSSCSSACSPA